MLFHQTVIIPKNIGMWAKILLNLAAECLFNIGLFYPQNFS